MDPAKIKVCLAVLSVGLVAVSVFGLVFGFTDDVSSSKPDPKRTSISHNHKSRFNTTKIDDSVDITEDRHALIADPDHVPLSTHGMNSSNVDDAPSPPTVAASKPWNFTEMFWGCFRSGKKFASKANVTRIPSSSSFEAHHHVVEGTNMWSLMERFIVIQAVVMRVNGFIDKVKETKSIMSTTMTSGFHYSILMITARYYRMTGMLGTLTNKTKGIYSMTTSKIQNVTTIQWRPPAFLNRKRRHQQMISDGSLDGSNRPDTSLAPNAPVESPARSQRKPSQAISDYWRKFYTFVIGADGVVSVNVQETFFINGEPEMNTEFVQELGSNDPGLDQNVVQIVDQIAQDNYSREDSQLEGNNIAVDGSVKAGFMTFLSITYAWVSSKVGVSAPSGITWVSIREWRIFDVKFLSKPQSNQ